MSQPKAIFTEVRRLSSSMVAPLGAREIFAPARWHRFCKNIFPAIPPSYGCMDGAGGRKAANYIYNSARPDGLTIGSVGGGVVVSAVLGETGVQYDLDKLHFVGTPYSASHYVLITRREAGLTTLDEFARPRPCAWAPRRSSNSRPRGERPARNLSN